MTIFKCKMCGGDLEITPGSTVCECEYCGTQQTLPKLDDDRRANMYDRANHFRRANEFDKAMSMYEKILEEDKTDSEAYWSIVLCRYGIEYVEDPATRKRIPTVNRAQFTSIFMDEDYKSAIEYADAYQRTVYEAEAAAIDEIQKGILAISQNEEPFDVFICYKETGTDGRRTRDSVLANDLYHQLTQEGFKVFFARITLEDKLGQEYEPYIFAALNSAKVMVVLGTKPEHFNAVWVKNEWSRYLMLIKNGAKKTLIPAYRDMDPYDLPEEFSHLQAQDMNKLGFMQDLIRGIKKITDADKEKPVVNKTTVINNNTAVPGNIEPLLKRAFMFLEDGEWDSANEYAEKVLDLDPECAKAYVVKLLADRKLNTQAELHFSKSKNADKLFTTPIENNPNYKKALRFADTDLKREFEKDAADNAEEYDRRRYKAAKAAMNSAVSEDDFKRVAKMFEEISYYKDSQSLIQPCLDKAEYARVDVLYEQYIQDFTKARTPQDYEKIRMKFISIREHRDSEVYLKKCEECKKSAKSRELYEKGIAAADCMSNAEKQKEAVSLFERCSDYRDAAQKAEECRKRIEELEQEAENKMIAAERDVKKKKMIIIASVAAVVIIIIGAIIGRMIYQNTLYTSAADAYSSGDYETALINYTKLGDYKDSLQKITDSKYAYAVALQGAEDFSTAKELFTQLGDYQDSAERISDCDNGIAYQTSEKQYESGNYADAKEGFSALGDYKDSKERIKECQYMQADDSLKSGKYSDAYTGFNGLGDYNDSKERAKEAKYCQAEEQFSKGDYMNAYNNYLSADDYKDSKEKVGKAEKALYDSAVKDYNSGNFSSAMDKFKKLSKYSDSQSYYAKSEIGIIKKSEVGDIVTLGRYEWYIYEKTGNSVKLLSKADVRKMKFGENNKSLTWEKSPIREYLNNSFYNDQFSSFEKKYIKKTHVHNPDYGLFGDVGYGGNDTDDYVYLLSLPEVGELDDAIFQADYHDPDEGYANVWWWTRSVYKETSSSVEIVVCSKNGKACGYPTANYGVRPALTIDISKL